MIECGETLWNKNLQEKINLKSSKYFKMLRNTESREETNKVICLTWIVKTWAKESWKIN